MQMASACAAVPAAGTRFGNGDGGGERERKCWYTRCFMMMKCCETGKGT